MRLRLQVRPPPLLLPPRWPLLHLFAAVLQKTQYPALVFVLLLSLLPVLPLPLVLMLLPPLPLLLVSVLLPTPVGVERGRRWPP